mmetsp:Transcript_113956/g.302856  ORF Transcript_113956/g.302856 Transcript_113956/m.302856 type:complete len:284 (+) Transcript_113956:1899-2750(+)
MTHRRPELLVHVRAARVARGQTYNDNRLAGRRRRAGILALGGLDDATCALKLKLQWLREEEALECQGLAARLVAIVVLIAAVDHKGVGLCGEGHLSVLRCLWHKPQLPSTRSKEVQHAHAFPAHHRQEAVRLLRLRRGRDVARLVRQISKGKAQEEVGAAVDTEAKVLLRKGPQELGEERVALVLRWQGRREKLRWGLVLEGLQQRDLPLAPLAQVARLEVCREPREEVVLLQAFHGAENLRALLAAQDDVHGGEAFLCQQLRHLAHQSLGNGAGPDDEVATL